MAKTALLSRLRPHLSVRMQLTLWYMVISTLLFALFGTIFFLQTRSGLLSNLDNKLQLRAQLVANSLVVRNGDITLKEEQGGTYSLVDYNIYKEMEGKGEYEKHEMDRLDADLDILIQIRNTAGRIAYSTPAFSFVPLPSDTTTQALKGRNSLSTLALGSNQKIRLYSQPLRYHEQIVGMVIIGAPLSPLENTFQEIMLELFIVVPIAVLLGIVGSFWLARRAFRPIIRLTNIARSIEADNLHSRVPMPRTRDEVYLLAKTFNEMIDRIEKTFYQQRRFMADASHELRTPVAAIQSVTDVALQRELSVEEHVALLEDINGQTQRLGNLISHLLTLARADEGHIPFEKEVLHLDQLVRDVAVTLEPLAQEKAIQLQIETDERANVCGDEARLMQVVMNLLNNAFKYTPQGGQVILRVKKQQTRAVLQIQDTGIGIAREHLEHIFERFYRVDIARSRDAGGAGLGLSIVQWIVEKYEGTITVESEPGKGSVFTVSLPLYKE